MSDVHVCMFKHTKQGGSEGMLHQKIGKNQMLRCSEIASEAILGQKQSCSSYVVCRVLHPVFACIFSM